MSSQVFVINAEEDTPYVSMEKGDARNLVVIKGLSMPENALEFYAPLSEKLSDFFGDAFNGLTMEVSLRYMNSMSNKQLLKLIKNLHTRDSNMKLAWKYQPNDDLIRMKGEEIRSILPGLTVEVQVES